MRKYIKASIALLPTIGFTLTSNAATSFSEDFTAGLGSNLSVNGTAQAASDPTVTGGAAVFPGPNDTRSYVGTNDTDYTAGFVAQVNVTVQTNNRTGAFFGFGQGERGAAAPSNSFQEPSSGAAVFISLADDVRNGGEVNWGSFNAGNVSGIANGNNEFVGGAAVTTAGNDPARALLGTGTHTLIAQYDGTTLTFSAVADIASLDTVVDIDTAAVTPLGSFDVTANMFDATNSGVFFGGENNNSFDNFSITAVPEPSSSLLVTLGLLTALSARKRKS